MLKRLKEFFAVTISGSLYQVSDEINQNNWPTVKKISGPDNPDLLPVGSCLEGGQLVGISDSGIYLFNFTSKYKRAFERMNVRYFGGGTGAIVGLFLEQSEAQKCVASGSHSILDSRYHVQTHAVIDQIGDYHPIFVIGETFGQSFNFW
jgi:hypothetical protein